MKLKNSSVMTALKGMIVGATMLVPGVSGGSMAMILGIYENLIASVSSFKKHMKENLLFLTLFSMGGLLGILLFARPLLKLIEQFPMPMLYFFLGAVAGGIPLILRQTAISKFSWKIPLYTALGLVIVLSLSALPAGTFQPVSGNGLIGYFSLIPAGLVAAVALVLPGISVSYLLLVMGLYDKTMLAIGNMDLPFLIFLGSGILLGIFLTTKLLERLLTRYPQPSYLIILGFIIGSMAEVFPGIPYGQDLPACLLTLCAGYFSIHRLSLKECEKSIQRQPKYE